MNAGGSATSWYFNLLAEDHVEGRQPNTGSRRYYYTDHLGSTRAVVQGTTVVESYDFEPWGLLMAGRTLGSGTKEGFTGKEQDSETGLEYFGARYYMPALGRWGAVDPTADRDPYWSAYAYVYDDPALHTDLDGRQVSQNPVTGGGRLEGEEARRYWRSLLRSRSPVPDDAVPPAPGEKPAPNWAERAVRWALTQMAGFAIITGNILQFTSPIPPSSVGFDVNDPNRRIPIGEKVVAQAGATLGWLPSGAGAKAGTRFVVDALGETRIFVRAGEGALEVSGHAAKRMWQRGVSLDVVAEVVGTQQPFQYFHKGVWKTGFYDPATKVFVGSVRGEITTVIDNASEGYIRNLQAVRPTQ